VGNPNGDLWSSMNHESHSDSRHAEQAKQNGKTPETGMIWVYRPPEAGAQVRILPGAPRLTS